MRWPGAALLALVLPCGACAFQVPAANPARPTIATPATLPPVGYLQFETGVLYAFDSPGLSNQFSINQVTKLTVHPRLELLLQSAPFSASSSGAGEENHPGDVLAGAQLVMRQGEGARPTIAASYLGRVYAGSAPDLDIGSARQELLLLASMDVRTFHFDINGMLNEQNEGGVSRAQFGQTISVSRTFGRLGIGGELWHFTQPLLRGNAVGNLWNASWSVRPNLVLDAGFQHGLTRTSTHWETFAGFTYLLPQRLWKR